ncbi:MAG: hypothetical protein KTU85_10470 [Acidimicrobiia bacterium]|nr:hypothetical protein [Acidimicrobiia bacterium]MCY4457817.1 hypothetical protein [Acidimicrobiaceae bacterium]
MSKFKNIMAALDGEQQHPLGTSQPTQPKRPQKAEAEVELHAEPPHEPNTRNRLTEAELNSIYEMLTTLRKKFFGTIVWGVACGMLLSAVLIAIITLVLIAVVGMNTPTTT